MKSGLAALAIAMCELKEEGIDLNGRIRFLATVGEEIGRIGSKQLVKEGYADDIDGLIIAEPSSSIIAYTHKGSMNFTVTAKGKSAHSSMPTEGINAINHIADFVLHFNEAMD
ncbi:M20/M25/M40 family metallo-hydrolase, partial [Aerococcus sp. HMSC10H05]|uniref:M20/M25/M40 family metallo-hydrolase n=1 Tax=Aerococcus sp. HMSC10H05 TaxID=1581084 RepID=UPI000AF88406